MFLTPQTETEQRCQAGHGVGFDGLEPHLYHLRQGKRFQPGFQKGVGEAFSKLLLLA